MTEDCSESCECTTTGIICQAKTCPENYVCTVYNFTRDCFRGGTVVTLEYICLHTQSNVNCVYICQKQLIVEINIDLFFELQKVPVSVTLV